MQPIVSLSFFHVNQNKELSADKNSKQWSASDEAEAM